MKRNQAKELAKNLLSIAKSIHTLSSKLERENVRHFEALEDIEGKLDNLMWMVDNARKDAEALEDFIEVTAALTKQDKPEEDEIPF